MRANDRTGHHLEWGKYMGCDIRDIPTEDLRTAYKYLKQMDEGLRYAIRVEIRRRRAAEVDVVWM